MVSVYPRHGLLTIGNTICFISIHSQHFSDGKSDAHGRGTWEGPQDLPGVFPWQCLPYAKTARRLKVSTLALHRPQIGYCLSLIPLHRLDQGTQIRGELFDFVRGECLRHGLFQCGF